MSQPNLAPSANGSATNGVTPHRRTVDWSGYPTLFQRVEPAGQSSGTVEIVSHSPQLAMRHSQSISEAFQAFCQAALFSPSFSTQIAHPSEITAAHRIFAAAEAYGLSRDELHRLGAGLYASPAAVQDDLRSMGFLDAEIEEAQFVTDANGRARAELAGCLLLPLSDETAQICDFLSVSVGENGNFAGYRFLHGHTKSQIVAYGLQAALSHPMSRESLVLVDDVLECLLLQFRGLQNVAAIGGAAKEFTPRRWEELARLGVKTVTLAFRQDERHAANIRDSLVNALRARTAPQVFVANLYPAGEQSAAGVLRRLGKEACSVALASRSLAFHDKDFGAAKRERRARVENTKRTNPVTKTQDVERESEVLEPCFRPAFRQHLNELIAALPAEERPWIDQTVSSIDAALKASDLPRAKWLLERSPFVAQWNWAYRTPQSWGPWSSCERLDDDSSIASAGAILDRVHKRSDATTVPMHLAHFAGRDQHPSIEWIVNSSACGRVAMLCERIIDACERRPTESFLVVCCEHTKRQMMLALVTHLAARLTSDKCPTVLEVEARLSGREPSTGYFAKPWLIDEAADRIRLWSNRLSFVTCAPTAAGYAAIENILEQARSTFQLGGVFMDAAPPSGTSFNDGGVPLLVGVASRTSGTFVIATSEMPAGSPAWWPGAHNHSHSPHYSTTGRQILSVLNDWLRREDEFARG